MTAADMRHRIANKLDEWSIRIRPPLNTPGRERDWNITADVDDGLDDLDAIEEMFDALIPRVGGSMTAGTVNVRVTTRGLSNLRIEETTDA